MAYTHQELLAEKARRQAARNSSLGGLEANSYSKEQLLAEKARRQALNSQNASSLPSETGEGNPSVDQPSSPSRSFGSRVKEGLAYAPRAVGIGARGAAKGALELADLALTPVRGGVNWGLEAAESSRRMPHLAEEFEQGFDRMTGGALIPQTPNERIWSEVAGGLGTLPAGGPIAKGLQLAAKAPGMAQLGKGIVSGISAISSKLGQKASNVSLPKFIAEAHAITPANVGATIGSSAAYRHYLNENPDDQIGGMGMSILGSLGGGYTAGGLNRLVPKSGQSLKSNWSDVMTPSEAVGNRIGQAIDFTRSKLRNFEEAGIQPTLANISDSKIVKVLQHQGEYVPFMGSKLKEATEKQSQAVRDALGLDGSLTKIQSGKLIKKAQEQLKEKKNAEHRKLFGQFEQDIDEQALKNVPVNITPNETNEYMSQFRKLIKTEKDEKEFLKTPVGKAYNRLEEKVRESEGHLDYDRFKEELNKVNDLITKRGEVGNITKGRLEQLAAAMNRDMERDVGKALQEHRPGAYENWKTAKEEYAKYKKDVVPAMNEIVRLDKKDAGSSFRRFLTDHQGEGKVIKMAMDGLDQPDRLKLISATHEALGSNRAGEFNPTKWATEFQKMTPEAREILLSALPEHSRKKLGNIATALEDVKSYAAQANTSKTAIHGEVIGTLASVSATAAALASGRLGTAVSMSMPLWGGYLAQDLFTSPKLINWIDKAMNAKDAKQAIKILKNVPNVPKHKAALAQASRQMTQNLEKAEELEKDKNTKKNRKDTKNMA